MSETKKSKGWSEMSDLEKKVDYEERQTKAAKEIDEVLSKYQLFVGGVIGLPTQENPTIHARVAFSDARPQIEAMKQSKKDDSKKD